MKNEQRFGTEGFEAGSERSEQVEVKLYLFLEVLPYTGE